MTVTCKLNSGEMLPSRWRDPGTDIGLSTVFPLTVGRNYTVYALALRGDQIWFFLHDDNALYYPMSYPSDLFEISDNRVPSTWHFRETPRSLDHTAIFAIREWVTDDFFYDRLTDGNVEEVRIFRTAKQIIDAEARDDRRASGEFVDI